jgi:hypothetical protein
MAEAGVVVGEAKTPSDFLKSIRGKPVIVKLNSGVDYRGMNHLTRPACSPVVICSGVLGASGCCRAAV